MRKYISYIFLPFLLLSGLIACSDKKTNSDQDTVVEATSEDAMFLISESGKDHIQALLKDYEILKDAMVEDKPALARTASQNLLNELKHFDSDSLTVEQKKVYDEYASKLKSDGLHMIVLDEVDHQREHLVTITASIYGLVKAFGGNEKPLYYQYCPMAFDNTGGYWLSTKEEVLNPYFGEAMLRCGKVEEVIAAK